MDRKSTGDITACFTAAKQFLKVAEMLSVDNICKMEYVRPFFVNAGLSCELFMKAIQMVESSDKSFCKGHDLNNLFTTISEDAQKCIMKLYNALYPKDKRAIELGSFLSRYSNPFLDFRYTFEHTAEGNSVALLCLAKSLCAYLSEIL